MIRLKGAGKLDQPFFCGLEEEVVMANQTEALRILSTNEEATSPSSIAKELKAGEPTIVTYLNRLKKKGYVDGGGKEWYITDSGRKFLETAKKVPVTKEDVGEDELSKFQWFGQLSGVDHDVITAVSELFQNTDMRSITEVERVLAEMNVPGTQRTKWKNLYRGYLRNTTEPEKRDELFPLPSPEEVRATGERATTEGGERLDYIVEDNNILLVGDGLGMFTFKQALQVVAAKRGTTPQVAQAGQQGQPLDADGVIKIVNAVREWGGGQSGQKSYVVTQGEEGAVVKEVQPGQPLVLSPPAGGNPPATWVVDGGEVRQLQPGEPLVIKQPVVAPPQKTFIVRQTSEGLVTEEHDVGKPIIINPAPASANPSPMMPYPVMDGEGKPVLGQDGQPVYANLEPMLRWMGFQGEQKRANERHTALMGLVEVVKENVPDGIRAFQMAAAEVKGKGKGSKEEPPQGQIYECDGCHIKFTLSREPAEGEEVECPNCHKKFPREEVIGT